MIHNWPEGIYPRSQKFYLLSRTTRFASMLTGQDSVLERDAAKWVAEFTFELEGNRARILDALIASLRGPAGKILVPDFRRITPAPASPSMDDYADEIGLTFFEDRYDFSDQTHDEGFLATEETPPLGAEQNALFGGGFDAILIFKDQVTLLTENNLILLADGVGIPFETDHGFLLTIEHGEALEIFAEEGYELKTQNFKYIARQISGGFFEGEGQPTLLKGGTRNSLKVGGLAPWHTIIKAGSGISPAQGHAHIILSDVETDINGYATIPIAPRLRTVIAEQPLILDGITVLMRLTEDDAGENNTVRPNRSLYTLKLEQILS
jgi:hypothetical protein